MAIASPRGPEGGAQAEFVVVPADSVAAVPDRVSLTEAATLPMNGLTARLALDLLGLAPGETLAVTGAAGAVGGYTMQLAKVAGLRVIGDALPRDSELVRGLGADVVVPRGDEAAAAIRLATGDGADALLDAALLNQLVLPGRADGDQIAAVRPFTGETERSIKVILVWVGDYLHAGDKLADLARLVSQARLDAAGEPDAPGRGRPGRRTGCWRRAGSGAASCSRSRAGLRMACLGRGPPQVPAVRSVTGWPVTAATI